MDIKEYIEDKLLEVNKLYNSETDSNKSNKHYYNGYLTSLIELKRFISKNNEPVH